MFIDNETGEVVEENSLEELKEEMALVVSDDILDKFEQVAMLQAQIEEWQNKQKETIMELFKKHGVKSFKNDYISITYKAPSSRRTLDSKKVEELLDTFQLNKEDYYRTSDVKESLSIKFKEV